MKIAIIGGGICGLYLAWKLSEKDNDVTVFERKKELGQEVCSGLFSERILEFIPLSTGLIQNKINFVLLHFPKKTATVKFSKGFFAMSHFELDRLVAGLAQSAGAKIILNHNVSSMPEGYDRIIGCDGANSFVRRSLNLPEPKYRLGILGSTETRSLLINRDRVSDNSINYVETWPCRTGFFWKIPKGKEIECGVIAEPKEARLIFDSFRLKEKKSRIIPQGFIIPNNLKITLCGDAIGLTKPWSGGGVVWGLTAAEILVKTFPNFLNYRKKIKRFFVPKIILAKLAVKLIYFLGFTIPWLLPKKTIIESDFLL